MNIAPLGAIRRFFGASPEYPRESSNLSVRLATVALETQSLKICAVVEQSLVAAVRNDVIDFFGELPALGAERLL
jgi:hypothetical protein